MILVTGDVVLDHNIYTGSRSTPDSDASLGMQHRRQAGGATLAVLFFSGKGQHDVEPLWLEGEEGLDSGIDHT